LVRASCCLLVVCVLGEDKLGSVMVCLYREQRAEGSGVAKRALHGSYVRCRRLREESIHISHVRNS
jgi:hypothetical protein